MKWLSGLILVLSFYAAYPAHAQMDGIVVTLDDSGKTITLKVNETFLLKLGENYDWNITVDDQTIISRVPNVLVVRGAQGLYRAHKPGRAALMAYGDPVCRKAEPPCAAPSIEFKLSLNVMGSAQQKTPAYETFFAISALLTAFLVRRWN